MKKSEIKIGGIYVAKVSNKLVNVRVDSIKTVPSYGDRTTTRYGVTNLATWRQTSFRSATKFRSLVGERHQSPTITKQTSFTVVGSNSYEDCHSDADPGL